MTETLLAEIAILRKRCAEYEQAIEGIKAEIKERVNFQNVDELVEVIRIIDKHTENADG